MPRTKEVKMQCPRCKHKKSHIVYTRAFGEQTQRRRVCYKCKGHFFTYEVADEASYISQRELFGEGHEKLN